MSKFVKRERLKLSIIRLSDWKGQVQSQTINHLFPFLALLSKGVNARDFKRYEESDDFDFFDTYFKVQGLKEEPYFDPLNRRFRIASHPHSNVATARKNTFQNRWNAGESETRGGETYWKLTPDTAKILAERTMTRAGGAPLRADVVDLSVWLFRDHEFADDADSDTLLKLFRQTFPMSDEEFDTLFQYSPEDSTQIFDALPLSVDDIKEITSELDLDDKAIRNLLSPTKINDKKGAESALAEDDPIFAEVQGLLSLGSSGLILRGAPGTSKSWYAWNLALKLTGNRADQIYRIQFHPSYGYEDFVEGYLPDEMSKSGFSVDDRVFLRAVDAARKSDGVVVVVIDEINRGDTSRIFGELLTYIEHGWRDVPFTAKLSGKEISIPKNLVVLATMNPHDRSITQLDMALLRRFDHVDILPSRETATDFMLEAGMDNAQADLVSAWFDELQRILPFGLGHAYFLNVGDVGRLGLVWRYRVLPFCESILEFEPERLDSVKRSFDALERRLRGLPAE